jgi:hypothetical protein
MPMTREQIERALREAAALRTGPGPELRARIREANEAATDWRATCRVCGETLTGTLAELRAHTHEQPTC